MSASSRTGLPRIYLILFPTESGCGGDCQRLWHAGPTYLSARTGNGMVMAGRYVAADEAADRDGKMDNGEFVASATNSPLVTGG